MTLSVIVSTYNAPRYLDLVLEGLSRQNDREFECIVADDGSTSETADVVQRYRPRFKVIHSWQADRGFRLAASRNQALAIASGAFAAFLDGDCIPHPDYVGDIKRAFQRLQKFASRCYLQGHRVILGARISAELSGTADIFSPGWILQHLADVSNGKNGFRFPAPLWPHVRLRGVRGCNMAFRTEDIREINGFDEEFVGWGHEDKDIVARLFRAGARRVDLRGAAIVYHLYHEEHSREEETINLGRALEARPIRAAHGIVKTAT